MGKKLEKALKEANKELKQKKLFDNYVIRVEGNFTGIYNEVQLYNDKTSHVFPVTYAETEGEAIAAVNAYMAGLRHGKDNSYPKLCDRDNY